jgi:hypothetical protein
VLPKDGNAGMRKMSERSAGRPRLAAAFVVSCVVLAACNGGVDTPAAPERSPAVEAPVTPTPEPSPAETPIGGVLVPPEEDAAIEDTVRGYFQAAGHGDHRRAKRTSVGLVRDLAIWGEGGLTAPTQSAALMPTTVTLDAVEVVEVAVNSAIVTLQGRLNESFFDPRSMGSSLVTTDISGEVSLKRKRGGWLVADYQRDGRPLTDAVKRLTGKQAASGVVLEMLALDVRKKGAILILKLRNPSGLEIFGERARIIDGSGDELVTDYPPNYALFVLPGTRKNATVGVYFPKAHTLRAKRFRFAIDFLVGCDPACAATPTFDVPVRVVR